MGSSLTDLSSVFPSRPGSRRAVTERRPGSVDSVWTSPRRPAYARCRGAGVPQPRVSVVDPCGQQCPSLLRHPEGLAPPPGCPRERQQTEAFHHRRPGHRGWRRVPAASTAPLRCLPPQPSVQRSDLHSSQSVSIKNN